ncbi:hypothetical protein [Geodermatophilus sp. FMUSA9-8]|uniref:hypothetical protein n=1 Tax=Geodermatophilus sp. FMUSA9-8 TaxID=3120155 RepID=UPI00300BE20B
MAISGLPTRKPTGRVPWPCVLLEGEEKAGKSWALAQLSTSDRIGPLYWIDLNEGAGDEYGAIPGARYELVEHDGSYAQVLAAVQAVKAEARRAADAGEKPVVLGIDTPARPSGTGSRTGRARAPRGRPATASCSSATPTPRSPSARTCGTTPAPAGASCRPSC